MTCKLFTDACHGNSEQFPDCIRTFEFNHTKDEQRTLCWRESVVCKLCDFKTEMVPLYKEIMTEKRGRKAGAPNIGLQIVFVESRLADSSTYVYQIVHGVSYSEP